MSPIMLLGSVVAVLILALLVSLLSLALHDYPED